MVTSMSCGMMVERALSTISRMASAAWIRFLPPRFLTSNITTDCPKSRAWVVASISLNRMVEISFKYMAPPSFFTTNSPKSEGVWISPITRMLRRWPLEMILPAETVEFSFRMAWMTSPKLTFDAIILRISTATSTSLSCVPRISTSLI